MRNCTIREIHLTQAYEKVGAEGYQGISRKKQTENKE